MTRWPVWAPALVLVAATVAITLPASEPAAASVTTISGPTRVEVREPRDPSGLSAKAGVVIDAGTGRVLWSRNRNAVRPIASTTKIMTALVAMQRSKPNDVLTATRYRAELGESLLGLKPGERMKARDLLTALMLTSANDAADTLAANLAPSKGAFVDAMNRRARALGLKHTRFGNPVGLDQPRTVSTAAELAELARVAMRKPEFAKIVRRSRAQLTSGSPRRTVYNRNELVGRYDFVNGVKTGHTLKAGYVLVGAAQRLDAEFVSAVLGEPSVPARNSDTLALLRFARRHVKVVPALPRGKIATTLRTTPGDNPVPLVPRRSLRLVARDGDVLRVVADTREEVRGPLAKGTRLGTAWVERNGKRVESTPLITTAAVAEPTVAEWFGYLLGRLLPLLAALAILFMMGLVLMRRRNRSRVERTAGERRQARAVEF